MGYITLRNHQEEKRNWAMFNASLLVGTWLPIINFILVDQGYWKFTESTALGMPFDLYFLWVILWGVIPCFFLLKKHFLIVFIAVFWMDIIFMPLLQKYGVLELHENWLIGEVLMILTVFIPSYLWSYSSYHSIYLWFRAVCQVIVMIGLIIIGLPFLLNHYQLISEVNYSWSPILLQVLLIIVFPALVAVQDLVIKGRGTPFPYDKTKRLVTTGVYAYCRNPIQWSLTWIFIPLCIYHETYFLLIGSVVSIAYVFGVSEFQEYPDMAKRYGEEWQNYIDKVPKWYFLWQPKFIPKGTIYFDMNCQQCSHIAQWFTNRNTQNLNIAPASTYNGEILTKVTYVDHQQNIYRGVNAIGHALEHINLAYATLGWFLRFYPLNYLFQLIVDTMGIGDEAETCDIK
ncbi:methyltransferase family protein [Flammeovirga pacifica]|nr:methyltransferase [Flammeovirga pacifica]